MSLFTILGISVALSMDAFAVSVSNGFMIKEFKLRHALRVSIFFGVFQAVMPVIGWAVGIAFVSYIKEIDHWIAFLLLAFIGGKLIYESRITGATRQDRERTSCTHFPTLLLFSLATSIDALAIGVSFALLDISILFPIAIIGGVTFAVCLVGFYIGDRLGHFFESKLEMIGGIILIGIGLKILLEHLFL